MAETLYFPGLGNLSITLNRVAFKIGPFQANWYGVIIAAGFLIVVIYCFSRLKKFGLNEDRVIDVIILGVLGGIVGARLFYVIFEFDQYKGDPLSIFRIWEGGLAIYGGLIGALLVGYIACYIRKVKFLPMLDVVASGFLIGQAIGRWGNFVNIEAYGCNTTLPWGMTSDSIVRYLTSKQAELAAQGITVDPNLPVHPCFLYESIWCLLGFLFLHWYTSRRKFEMCIRDRHHGAHRLFSVWWSIWIS